MSDSRLTLEQVEDIIARCNDIIKSDLAEYVRLIPEESATQDQIVKSSQALYEKVKALVKDADSLGVVSNDGMAAATSWIGQNAVVVARKKFITLKIQTRVSTDRVDVWRAKDIAENFRSAVGHVRNNAKRLRELFVNPSEASRDQIRKARFFSGEQYSSNTHHFYWMPKEISAP